MNIALIVTCLIFQYGFSSQQALLPTPQPKTHAQNMPLITTQMVQQLPMLRIGFSNQYNSMPNTQPTNISTRSKIALNPQAALFTPYVLPLAIKSLVAHNSHSIGQPALSPAEKQTVDSEDLADWFNNWGKDENSFATQISATSSSSDKTNNIEKELNALINGNSLDFKWLPKGIDYHVVQKALEVCKDIPGSLKTYRVLIGKIKCLTSDKANFSGALYELAVACHLKTKNPQQELSLSKVYPKAHSCGIEIDIETSSHLIECKNTIYKNYDEYESFKKQLLKRQRLAHSLQKDVKLITAMYPEDQIVNWLNEHRISFEIIPGFHREVSTQQLETQDSIKVELEKISNRQEFKLHWIPDGTLDKKVLHEILEFARNIPGSMGQPQSPINKVFSYDFAEAQFAIYNLSTAFALHKLNHNIIRMARIQLIPGRIKPAYLNIETDKYIITCKHDNWRANSDQIPLQKKLLHFKNNKAQQKKILLICAYEPRPKFQVWLKENAIEWKLFNNDHLLAIGENAHTR